MEEDVQGGWRLQRRAIMFIALTIILMATAVGASYSLNYLQICVGTPSTIGFTILITNQGFNQSRNHTDQWPVLDVARCSKVSVHLENQDTSESHGFAITHYLDSGVKVHPGESVDVSFYANRAGSFLVYCNILCSIHPFMQNGRLNVR